MPRPALLTDDELEQVKLYVTYDMNTGEFRPTSLYFRTGGRAIMYGVERRTGRGYVKVNVLGKTYMAHRLAWAMVYGDTRSPVYHKNGKLNDNRLSNLTRAKKVLALSGKIE